MCANKDGDLSEHAAYLILYRHAIAFGLHDAAPALLYTDWSQLTEVLLVQEGDQLRENALG